MKKFFFFSFLLFISFSLFPQNISYYRYVEPREGIKLAFISPVDKETAKKDIVYEVTRDSKGRVSKIRYLRKNEPFPDNVFGVNQVLFVYGSDQDIVFFENSLGLGMDNPIGTQKIIFNKDEKGQYTQSFFYNLMGDLAPSQEGVASILWEWESPNKVKSLYLNEEGEPTLSSKGVFQQISEWQGDEEKIYYLDGKGNPILDKDRIAGVHKFYYPDGRVFMEKFFGLREEPRANAYGILSTMYIYDEDHNLVQKSTFDSQGNLIEDNTGVAVYKFDYDLSQNLKRTFNYDQNNELTLDSKGVAMYKEVLYLQSNEREVSHYGTEKNPYYEQAKNARNIKYDEELKLTNNFYGVAVTRYVYDNNGNLLEKRIFDENRQITRDEQGVFLYKQTFDKRGLRESIENYSDFTRPTEDTEGIFRYEFTYDEEGNLTSKKQIGKDGQLKQDRDGIAIYEWVYNSAGLPFQQKNYGEHNQLKENKEGVALYEWTYDRSRRKVEQTNYGIDGKLQEDKAGVAIYKWLYNDKGDLVQYQRFDKQKSLLKG